MRIQIKTLAAILIVVFFLPACRDEENSSGRQNPIAPENIDLSNSFYYQINLDDRTGDTFKVRLFVDNLTDDNAIFQFPATTPGTYDIHDIGRFVTEFKAYDVDYKELEVTHTAPSNQWVLSDPENTRIIEFEVKETFDTPVTEYPIYRMAGTSLENNHALLNNFDILGYPTGLKERDFYLSIDYPSAWSVGTALPKDENGYYYATDFDKLVDSPILLGYITKASTTVASADIEVVSYSKNNLIQAGSVLNEVESILDDANEFLNGLPTDHYSFIFFFEPASSAGALEHSFSSVYILNEPGYANALYAVRSITAHEFFHVVTPLNIHSEIIEDFNFAVPTPSEHLWLYEGITEWASLTMQLRNENHLSLPEWLAEFAAKKSRADYYAGLASNRSLSEMSLTCYGEGGPQFGNVYNKGALAAALLDIRLLELSGGTRGLRELILDLIDTYGQEQPFSEENFFTDFAQLSGYPTEVTDFLDKYIKGTDPLPVNEYFTKVGISFTNYQFTIEPNPTAEQLALRQKLVVNF
jgi:predicted metalloprotease with PDZ domain